MMIQEKPQQYGCSCDKKMCECPFHRGNNDCYLIHADCEMKAESFHYHCCHILGPLLERKLIELPKDESSCFDQFIKHSETDEMIEIGRLQEDQEQLEINLQLSRIEELFITICHDCYEDGGICGLNAWKIKQFYPDEWNRLFALAIAKSHPTFICYLDKISLKNLASNFDGLRRLEIYLGYFDPIRSEIVEDRIMFTGFYNNETITRTLRSRVGQFHRFSLHLDPCPIEFNQLTMNFDKVVIYVQNNELILLGKSNENASKNKIILKIPLERAM